MRTAAFEVESIALCQNEAVVVHPELQFAAEHHAAFLAFMRIGFLARAAARIEHDLHHLQRALIVDGQERLHHPLVAEIDGAPPRLAHDDAILAACAVTLGEEGQERNADHLADGAKVADRR